MYCLWTTPTMFVHNQIIDIIFLHITKLHNHASSSRQSSTHGRKLQMHILAVFSITNSVLVSYMVGKKNTLSQQQELVQNPFALHTGHVLYQIMFGKLYKILQNMYNRIIQCPKHYLLSFCIDIFTYKFSKSISNQQACIHYYNNFVLCFLFK